MSNTLSNTRLATIHFQVSAFVRRRRVDDKRRWWLTLNGDCVIEAHDLANILDELRRRRGNNSRCVGQRHIGETTKLLMKMEVGRTVIVPAMPRPKLTSARATARKKMDIPNAVWYSESLPDGMMRITRGPDGASPNEAKTSPVVLILVKMAISQRKTISDTRGMTGRGYLTHGMKLRARQIMENNEANWKCEKLINGKLRITRVA